jgi:hypothetical protein
MRSITTEEPMRGRLIRVRTPDLRSTTYVVAVAEAGNAVELIRRSIGTDGDQVADLGPLRGELLNALGLEPGEFANIDDPRILEEQAGQPRKLPKGA